MPYYYPSIIALHFMLAKMYFFSNLSNKLCWPIYFSNFSITQKKFCKIYLANNILQNLQNIYQHYVSQYIFLIFPIA